MVTHYCSVGANTGFRQATIVKNMRQLEDESKKEEERIVLLGRDMKAYKQEENS